MNEGTAKGINAPFFSNVQPRRIIRPARQPWTCRCGEHNPRYLVACRGCGTERADK